VALFSAIFGYNLTKNASAFSINAIFVAKLSDIACQLGRMLLPSTTHF
jgi:hypothetical protein